MPTGSSIATLYQRYLDNDLSAGELNHFLQLLQQAENEEQVSQLMEATWAEMFDKEPAKVRRLFSWKKIAVAASILLLLGAGYLLLIDRKPTQTGISKSQTERFKNDILPSSQGAVLTLANGDKIYLDSAANGVLTNQGNVKVTKQGGQIAYAGAAGNAVAYNTMTTQKGKQYMLLLADGTKAWLNAASSITYPTAFTGLERKVEVTGEVYFEVAHDASKKFTVAANGVTTEVLGTHFNVNTYSDEGSTKITLLEGSVNVSFANQAIKIAPGQQAVVTDNGQLITDNSVNTEKIMAWKNNLFWFDNEDLPAIMKELARWYDADIVFEEKVSSRYGFVLDRNLPVSKLLQVLELTGGVHFRIEGKRIIVSK